MLSTLPAMSSRTGCAVYRHSYMANISRQSGASSYCLISCPMMPCSFSTVAAVKYGRETKPSRISKFSATLPEAVKM